MRGFRRPSLLEGGYGRPSGVVFSAVSWDDDDWKGEPPEGRHTRDRAKPGFWQNQWQAVAATSVLGVLVLIVVLVLLLG